jgi:biopolymer transport protein ExbB/TolQ
MPYPKVSRSALTALLFALAAPGVASAATHRLTLGNVFADASPEVKLVMLLLVVGALAAVIVTVLKLASGRRLSGGSAYVAALRLGGPLLGLVGAVFVLLMGFIAIANAGQPVPMGVLAPGYAEAALLFLLGLLAGVVGVICHGVIEARIDRTVLGS